jgi:hypothetical protein
VKIFQDRCQASSDFWRWWKNLGQLHPIDPHAPSELRQEWGPTCVKNVLAHIRVLAPSVPLEKLREETDDDKYLESFESTESEVEDLANFITEKLDIHLPPSDDEADS